MVTPEELNADIDRLAQTALGIKAENDRLHRSVAELKRRLKEAESLLKRGVSCMHRVGWENGETDDEWTMKASQWIGLQKLEREIEAEQKGRARGAD